MHFSPDLLYGWLQDNSVDATKQEMFGKPPKFKVYCGFTIKTIIFQVLMTVMQLDSVQGYKNK